MIFTPAIINYILEFMNISKFLQIIVNNKILQDNAHIIIDNYKLYHFIQSNLEWVKYKDHELVNEYCHVVKSNMCRGIEPKLKKYINDHAKAYEKENV